MSKRTSPAHEVLAEVENWDLRDVEKKFKLGTRKYEQYKGVRFGNGDCALVIDVWLHRVDEVA